METQEMEPILGMTESSGKRLFLRTEIRDVDPHISFAKTLDQHYMPNGALLEAVMSMLFA